MVTSSEDGTVKIWDTRSGNVQRNYTHGVPVNDVVIHPNQGELISCDRGGNVRIWDLGENKCSHQLIPEDDVSVASVTVASDGTMLCAGNNAVGFTTPRSHQLLTAGPTGQRLCLAYDPTRRRNFSRACLQICCSSDLHHPRTPLPRRPPPGHLLRRPHSAHLVSRPSRPSQYHTTRPASHGCRARRQRFSARDYPSRTPTLGLGLRVQC